MEIKLSEHFTFGKLLKFVFPSVVMMVFTSIYNVVDGFFVSNFVGKASFAAVNLITPLLMLGGAIGFMIGTGGSALVAKLLGAGDKEKANRIFSLLIYATIVISMVLSVCGMIFFKRIAFRLGARGEVLEDCVRYGMILMPALVMFLLQNEFQSFLIVAEKPKLGLALTVAAGLTNIVLDALFVAIFRWGLAGAAWATVISQCIGGLVPLAYFIKPNKTPLRLTKTKLDRSALLKTFTNGSSELMSNISMSVVSMLYNFRLIRFAGENGVAAYGVIMYIGFVFSAIFFGYMLGSSPIVSYHFGAENRSELKNIFRKSAVFIAIIGVAMTAIAIVSAPLIAHIFVGYDEQLRELTIRALTLYSFAFLFTGFNIFGSAFFTALNDGFISALISFLRTLVFEVAAVLVLPELFGIDGVWLSVTAAECAALAVTLACFIKMRKTYGYA